MTHSPLVSTEWLAEHIDDPKIVILDATWYMPGDPRDAARTFAEGHIPGARFFSINDICDQTSDLPHMLSDPADFAIDARRLGVNPDSTVVVYDGEGLFSAARVWWNFRAMGHSTVVVMDGGLPRWIDEGRAVETGWREAPHGEFKSHPESALVRNLDAVRAALADGATQIIDARSAGRFTGEAPEPRAELRGGHMPGALNMPWNTLVEHGALRLPRALKTAFDAAGVDLSAPIITSCGSGVSAAVLALALAVIGRGDAAVYDGSWSEWGARKDTPIVTGP